MPRDPLPGNVCVDFALTGTIRVCGLWGLMEVDSVIRTLLFDIFLLLRQTAVDALFDLMKYRLTAEILIGILMKITTSANLVVLIIARS